jgi:hypothetical protein
LTRVSGVFDAKNGHLRAAVDAHCALAMEALICKALRDLIA